MLLSQTRPLLPGSLNITERQCRTESLALPRLVDRAVQLVDFLESEAFGLVDHVPDEGDAEEARLVSVKPFAASFKTRHVSVLILDLPERTPDEEDARLQVPAVYVDHVGGYEGDDEVEEPVGGGGLALR